MAAGEAAAAAAKMDALEADMARTEKKLARAAQKSHTYGSLLANGMMDKVLWLIDHPCEHTCTVYTVQLFSFMHELGLPLFAALDLLMHILTILVCPDHTGRVGWPGSTFVSHSTLPERH